MSAPMRAAGCGAKPPWLSIVMPVLDEARILPAALDALQPLRSRGVELIVVDGGSGDASAAIARAGADLVLAAARGRAVQMNAGARAARGDVLLFLHADTRLPARADRLVLDALARSDAAWGRFDVRIEGAPALLPVIAAFMNARSRLTGIATGDQAIFVRREAFDAAGGYPPIALMEDIELARALGRIGAPQCLRNRVVTSGRRWEAQGPLRVMLRMWWLRLAWSLGADARALAARYERDR